MTNEQIKHALISIVLGALTIFATELLSGLLHFIKEWASDTLGVTVTATTYLYKVRNLL